MIELDAFVSLATAPLDAYTVPDIGDTESNPDGMPKRSLLQAARVARLVTPPALVVPYVRSLSLGSVGLDVVGAKRAIWRANDLPHGTFTRLFGPIPVKQLRVFQRAHGLTPDGTLGPATLQKLGRFFDHYAFLLYTGYAPGGTADDRHRRMVVAYMTWGYNNRLQIHYGLFRPMYGMTDLERLPITEDCSTIATKSYKFGLLPDPNHLSYDGYGNTGTMRQHGRLVSLAAARPGDLVHYNAPDHVAVYVGAGRVISHGSEIGPLLTSATYRPVAQVRTYI